MNILPPLDIFTEDKFGYAVYEYSTFNNLQDYLKKKGKLTEIQLLDILKQIRDAYKYIKDNKLIHGNIKPTNILVDEKDKLIIKLTDFLICSKNSKHLLNDEFIAPEITFEEIKPNIISDIYSIGAIMKLLIEKAESSTDTYSKLMQDCLQIDSNKRIKFGIFKFHSYFTSYSYF